MSVFNAENYIFIKNGITLNCFLIVDNKPRTKTNTSQNNIARPSNKRGRAISSLKVLYCLYNL